jgi:hypothetical protein
MSAILKELTKITGYIWKPELSDEVNRVQLAYMADILKDEEFAKLGSGAANYCEVVSEAHRKKAPIPLPPDFVPEKKTRGRKKAPVIPVEDEEMPDIDSLEILEILADLDDSDDAPETVAKPPAKRTRGRAPAKEAKPAKRQAPTPTVAKDEDEDEDEEDFDEEDFDEDDFEGDEDEDEDEDDGRAQTAARRRVVTIPEEVKKVRGRAPEAELPKPRRRAPEPEPEVELPKPRRRAPEPEPEVELPKPRRRALEPAVSEEKPRRRALEPAVSEEKPKRRAKKATSSKKAEPTEKGTKGDGKAIFEFRALILLNPSWTKAEVGEAFDQTGLDLAPSTRNLLWYNTRHTCSVLRALGMLG